MIAAAIELLDAGRPLPEIRRALMREFGCTLHEARQAIREAYQIIAGRKGGDHG